MSTNKTITGLGVIPFMKLRLFAAIVSLVLIAFSIYSILTHGFNFGVDFQGGVKLIYEFSEPTTDTQIRETLETADFGDVQVVPYGEQEGMGFLIKAKFDENRQVAQEITAALEKQLSSNQITLLSEESVGPKVGAELRQRGLFAVLLTWVLILIYVGVRFDFQFSPGALISLIHDLVITLGVFTLLDKEINLPILAALLTIIGYSINDTIVIYDRIRENLKKMSSKLAVVDVVNASLSETLRRTLVTSITLLFAVLVLFYLGGGVLHDFAFTMIIGVIVGTYSSIFVASPIYLIFNKILPKQGKLRKAS